MTAYYNEFDPFAAAWLRNLIAENLISPGDVDERSIAEVRPDDLDGYDQCHFFAGIGGWPYALRLAGWPDDRPVWTGSCPCQPFSAAGRRGAADDERHLWPAFYRLIAERHPATVFGEQVASALGRTWLAAVRSDMEHVGYAVGAADLPAAGVGARHIRRRLWWVADACGTGLPRHFEHREGIRGFPQAPSAKCGDSSLRERVCYQPDPGSIERIDGLPRPVGQVRGFGNAIVPTLAAEFIGAKMDCDEAQYSL